MANAVLPESSLIPHRTLRRPIRWRIITGFECEHWSWSGGLCAGLDKNTPPEEFSVPLDRGRLLTIKTDGEVSWDRVYLVSAGFGPDIQGPWRRYVLAAGKGFVDLSPEPRQLFFHVYRPGEKVPVRAFFGGAAAASLVAVDVRPESGASPLSSQVTVPLSAAGPGLAGGEFSWQVPMMRGPAQVHVREEVQGQTVYETSFRIAIAPEVDLVDCGLPFWRASVGLGLFLPRR